MNDRLMGEKFSNLTLEIEVLGAMADNEKCLNSGMMKLDEDCFYRKSEKLIFKAMKNLWSLGKPATVGTISQELGKRLAEVDTNNLYSLLDYSYNKSIFNNLANELIELKKAYKVYKLADKINVLFHEEKDYKDVVGYITTELDGLNNDTEIEDGDTVKAYEENKKDLKARSEKGGGIVGLKTGFNDLDNYLNGLKQKTLTIIAGRPGMGKTTVMSNIGVNVAKSGKNVAMFTLEMSKSEMINKILANLTGLKFEKIEKANLSESDWDLILANDSRAKDIFSRMSMFDRTFQLKDILAISKNLHKKGKLDLLIVDYLQLAEFSSKDRNREQEVAKISRAFKNLASELAIPVITLSQLSRAPEQRADHRPLMSDLRESGGIENDANTIIMCYRDEYYNKESEDKGIIELIIVKNRSGRSGTIKLAWIPDYQAIEQLDLIHKEEQAYNQKPKQNKWKAEQVEMDDDFPF